VSEDSELRYSRHLALAGFSPATQERLSQSSVLLIGLGGLGCPTALYLATSGVGHLLLSDFDKIDLSNLHRQILYTTNDIGGQKTQVAARRLQQHNPDTRISLLDQRLQGRELATRVASVDLVIDCSDNFGTRFEVNRACVGTKTPLISGAAIRFEGQVAVFDLRDDDSPCYQCLFPEAGDELEDCRGSGVLAPLTGVIGGLAAVEAIKLLGKLATPAYGRLFRFDAGTGDWQSAGIKKDSACPACHSN